MLGLVSEDFAKHIEQLNNQRPGDESVAGPCGSWEAQLGWTPKQKWQPMSPPSIVLGPQHISALTLDGTTANAGIHCIHVEPL